MNDKPKDKFAKYRSLSEEDKNSITAMALYGKKEGSSSSKTVGQKIVEVLNSDSTHKKGNPRKQIGIYMNPEYIKQIKIYIASNSDESGLKSISDFVELAVVELLKKVDK
ncbi:MAG: hypothetical protein LBI63_02575 [Candidatus Ancillula sp.]|jgi:hypothetical protein|nr:hypothetical protein [Candidatus Ancillula sp.]